MKRYAWTAAALAVGTICIVGVAAQGGATKSAERMSNNGGSTVTVTGCLQQGAGAERGTSSATASSEAASASTPGGAYTLANATTGTTGAKSSAGTSGTSEPGKSGSAAGMASTSYILEGHESDLKKHVGHRIEVTGTTSGAMGSGPGSMSAGGSGSTASGSGSAATTGAAGSTGATGTSSATTGSAHGGASMANAHLRVNSIRMISSDCSNSGR